MPGKLQCDMPDTAGTTMDQDGLTRLQVGALDQCFPSRDQHQRQRGAVLQVDIAWGSRAIFLMHRGEFGITARLVTLVPAQSAVVEKYRITSLETRYRIAGLFHDACAIATQYRGQLVGMIKRLGAQLGIQR